VFEDDHLIFNNYIDTEDTPLVLSNGDPPGGGHAAVHRVKAVFNTIVVRDAPVALGSGGHDLPPADSVFANNLIIGSRTLLSERGKTGIAYEGNIAFRSGGGGIGVNKSADQFRVVDPALMQVGEVQRPTAKSAVVGAARGTYGFVGRDIDEQERSDADVGADEVAAGAAPGPLTAAQVGPDAL
jgi:hypothetical protein